MVILSSKKSALRQFIGSIYIFFISLDRELQSPTGSDQVCIKQFKLHDHILYLLDRSPIQVCVKQPTQRTLPQSKSSIISMISNATIGKRKIEVATRYGHSMAKLVCPDGRDGLLISTKILNRVLKIDFQAMTMPVESGATLRQVINGAIKDGVTVDKAGCALEG